MRENFNKLQSLLVTATAVRKADENFQDHILTADTAPALKLTAIRNENNSFVQPRKRLPLKMMISAMASRDVDTAEREREHQTIYSHTANTSYHTLLDKNKDPSRCFAEKLLVDPGEHPASQSEYAFLSDILKDPGNERVGLDCQTTFLERPHSGKGDGSCSNNADQSKLFPHGHYSTPCAKSRFNSLYGSEVLNKNVKRELPGSQIHQTERTVWVDNADVKDKDKTKKLDYQSHSSALSKDTDIDTWYEHETEDTCDNTSLESYSLHYPPTNLESPMLMKGANGSTNENNILSSPPSTYSSINIYSDWSTEDEYEQANHKRKLDSDYTSENCFLHPLAKFKSKHQKAQNADTNLLHTVKSRNVSNWKPDCEYIVNNSEYILPNTDQRYSDDNLSSICGSNTDEIESSADLTSWCRVKYTRRTQMIRISTKPSGPTEFVPRNQILNDVQPINSETECSLPSDWDSLSENKEINIMPYLSSPEE